MKRTLIIILVLALLCTALCACGRDDRDSGNVSDNDNGVITDENDGDDIFDRTEDDKGGTKTSPVPTSIPDGSSNNGSGGTVNPTQPVTP
ncbi:MAG: hypothetical protein Q4A83_00260 [Bacillota bacterium]|nr:hypothetical protein [Bacillota bacterium]